MSSSPDNKYPDSWNAYELDVTKESEYTKRFLLEVKGLYVPKDCIVMRDETHKFWGKQWTAKIYAVAKALEIWPGASETEKARAKAKKTGREENTAVMKN